MQLVNSRKSGSAEIDQHNCAKDQRRKNASSKYKEIKTAVGIAAVGKLSHEGLLCQGTALVVSIVDYGRIIIHVMLLFIIIMITV